MVKRKEEKLNVSPVWIKNKVGREVVVPMYLAKKLIIKDDAELLADKQVEKEVSNRAKLNKLSKNALIYMAKDLNIDFVDTDTKDTLIEKIDKIK